MKIKNLLPLILIFFWNIHSAGAFLDVTPDTPHVEAIEYYEQHQLIDGYDDGRFLGEEEINRVEALKMMLQINSIPLASTQKTSLPYQDLIQDAWYMPYLKYAHAYQYVQGYPDSTFRPNNPVTLAETLSLLYKIYDYSVEDAPPDRWFEPYVEDAKNRGLLAAIPHENPHQNLTRGEVIDLIYQMEKEYHLITSVRFEKPYTLKTLSELETIMSTAAAEELESLAKLQTRIEYDIYNDYQLPVAVHLQERPLSCEVASLKAVLNYHGVQKTETALFEALEKALPFEYNAEENTWGDPHKGFVGDVYGSQIEKTGYGVYWDPIAALAQNYKSNSFAFSNEDVSFLLNHVLNDQPVIIWGYFGPQDAAVDLSWETPQGKSIHALNTEHTFTVIGFEGNIHDPTALILIDPLQGLITQSIEAFLEQWSAFDNSGVVVQ